MVIEGAVPARFQEVFADGSRPRATLRPLAEEAPVAIEINGVAYAVMMATPTDLADYALGFCLSEGLIEQPQQLLGVDAAPVEAGGWVLRIQLSAPCAAPLLERARLRLSEGSCGLCGIESLEQVLRPLPQVTARLDVPPHALFRAVSELGRSNRWAGPRVLPMPLPCAHRMARSGWCAKMWVATMRSTNCWAARPENNFACLSISFC